MNAKPEKQSQFIEPDTHSFVIKFWLDDQDEDTGRVTWRGHITHVASDQYRYFDNLSDLIGFLFPYLNAMNIKVSIFWRVFRWLTQ